MFSCSGKSPKFKSDTCLKGEYLTFTVLREADWNHSYYYQLRIIGPETSIRFGDVVHLRDKVVEKAFQAVSCAD